MKPLYLITSTFFPRRGGQEELVDRLATELGKRYRTTVVSPSCGTIHSANKPTRPYDIILTKPFGLSPISPYKVASGQLSFFVSLSKYLKGERVGVMHLFEPFLLGLGAVGLRKLAKSKFVLSLIGSSTYDPFSKTHIRFRRYMEFVMKQADIVTASTTELAERGRDQGYHGDVRIIPHCIDIERFHPRNSEARASVLQKHDISTEDPVVVAVQRLHPRKRVSQLVLAARYVLKSEPRTKFLIGGRGREMEKLQLMIRKFELEDSVKLIGFVSDADLPNYYAAADVFALHTLYEGFGIVAIEAMASGTPVVTTDVGGFKEIVSDNGAGFIVPPNSPREFSEAILKILSNRQTANRISINCRSAAERLYSTEQVTSQYSKLYEELGINE